MTQKELIRQEIERRLQRENEILWNAKKRGTYPSPSCEYNLLTLTSLRDFIDSLPEEKLSEDLEEAAEEYADKHGFRVPYDGSNNYYDDVDVKASKEGFLAGAEWGARHSINWGDVQLLDTFILELSREEKDGADWGDSEKFYTEVLRRFHEFNDKKIPEIVAEWEAKHLK